MTYAEFVRRALTLVGIVILAFVIMMGLWELSSILLIAFTCWVLSVGLNALIMRVERRNISRGVAALIVILGVILFLSILVAIILPPFIRQVTNLVEGLGPAVESLVSGYEDFYTSESTPTALREVLPEFTIEDYNDLLSGGALGEIMADQGGAIDLGVIAGSAIPILGGIGSFIGSLLANLGIIILISGYLVADPLVYYRPIVSIVPKEHEQRAVEILDRIRQSILAWMGALSVSITVTSVAVTLVVGVLLQVPNALALGVIAGLGTLVPNLGYYIGLIPIIIFTAAADPAKVIPAAFLYWLINELEGKLVAPVVIKEELDIPAGVVIPFQLIAAAVFGFFGILLAVPILAIIVTLVREIYVFDTLGKRDHHAEVMQDGLGRLYLDTAPEAAD
ncbi:MAG: AI-2E family transporter [Anaerolineae bacterium]